MGFPSATAVPSHTAGDAGKAVGTDATHFSVLLLFLFLWRISGSAAQCLPLSLRVVDGFGGQSVEGSSSSQSPFLDFRVIFLVILKDVLDLRLDFNSLM